MNRADVVIVGGGIAGASLGKSLAEAGVNVTIVEREVSFKDRVRGEQMQPWGVGEARALGILEILQRTCSHDQPWIDMYLGPAQIAHRNLVETTMQQAPHLNFYHPRMQETLIDAAAAAGAKVRRGDSVAAVMAGDAPRVVLDGEGGEEISARLIVGADGRTSMLRRSGGFEVKRDEDFLIIAGVLLDHMQIADDTGLIYMNPAVSYGSYLFPQGGGRVRAYVAYPASAPFRVQGEKDLPRFIEISTQAGAPAEILAGAKVAGPLASFDAADHWIEHPSRKGFVLVGDAAASNDPSWGQGLSITLRDVRVLRDCLLKSSDWDRACDEYAREHDRHYGVIHEVTHAFKDMFMRSGAQADQTRGRALPLIASDPMRVPDHLFNGPDLPWNEDVRRTFFARDALTM